VEVLVRHHRRSPSEILTALREAVDDFAEGRPADDDRTAIIIKRRR
jgi:serine phosphatase RsbU (regulator of sigma subunit)